MPKQNGYTLIEAITILAIVSILMALAIPDMREGIASSKISSSADGLFTLIRFARTEASRQGVNVRVAPLDGVNWATGARAWTERDGVNGFNPAQDVLLRETITNASGVKITEIANIQMIGFNGQGYAAAAIQLEFCDSRKVNGRTINVLASGFTIMRVRDVCI